MRVKVEDLSWLVLWIHHFPSTFETHFWGDMLVFESQLVHAQPAHAQHLILLPSHGLYSTILLWVACLGVVHTAC
jgi:hypothetical protein